MFVLKPKDLSLLFVVVLCTAILTSATEDQYTEEAFPTSESEDSVQDSASAQRVKEYTEQLKQLKDDVETQEELKKRFEAGLDVSETQDYKVPDTMTDQQFFDLDNYQPMAANGAKNPITGEVTENDLKPMYGKISLGREIKNDVMVQTFTRGKVVTHPDFAELDESMHSHLKSVVAPVNARRKNGALSMIQKHMGPKIADMFANRQRTLSVNENELAELGQETVGDQEAEDDSEALIDDMDQASFLKHADTMKKLREKGMILFSDPRDGVFSATCEFMSKHSAHLKKGSVFSIPLGLFKIKEIKEPKGQPKWKQGLKLKCDDDSLPYHITTSNADIEDAVKDATVHVEITDLNPLSRNAETGEIQDNSVKGRKSNNARLARQMLRDHRILEATKQYERSTETALMDMDDTVWKLASKVGAKYGKTNSGVIQATREFRDTIRDHTRNLLDENRDDVIASAVAEAELEDLRREQEEQDEEMSGDKIMDDVDDDQYGDDDEEHGDDEPVEDGNRNFWRVFRRIRRAFNSIANALKRAFSSLGNFIRRTWNSVSNAMNNAFRHMKGAVMRAVNTISRVAKQVGHRFNRFAHAVARAASHFAKAVVAAAHHVGRAVNHVVHKVAKAMVAIGKAIVKVAKAVVKIVKFIIALLSGQEVGFELPVSVGFKAVNMDLGNQRDTHMDKFAEWRKKKADEKKAKKAAEKAKKNPKKAKKSSKKSSKKGKKGKDKKDKKKGAVQLEVLIRIIKAQIAIKPTLVLALRLRLFWLTKVKVEIKGSLDCTAKALVQINAVYRKEKEKLVATKGITRVKFMIGPVPVWVKVEGQFYVGMALTIKAGIQFHVGGYIRGRFRVGLSVDLEKAIRGKKPIHFINRSSIEKKFEKPKGFRPCASVELEFFLRPQVAFKLYDVAGPTAGLEPYVLLKFIPQGARECVTVVETHEKLVKKNSTPTQTGKNTLELYVGIRVKAGVQIGFKGKMFVDETIPLLEKAIKVFSFSLPIGKKGGNIMDGVASRRLETISTHELANMKASRDPTRYYSWMSHDQVSNEEMTVTDLREAAVQDQPSLEEIADELVEDVMDKVRVQDKDNSHWGHFRERSYPAKFGFRFYTVERDTYAYQDQANLLIHWYHHWIRHWHRIIHHVHHEIHRNKPQLRWFHRCNHMWHHYNRLWHHYNHLAHRHRGLHRIVLFHRRNHMGHLRHIWGVRRAHSWVGKKHNVIRHHQHLIHVYSKTKIPALVHQRNHFNWLYDFRARHLHEKHLRNQRRHQKNHWHRVHHDLNRKWHHENHVAHHVFLRRRHHARRVRAHYLRKFHHERHLAHRHRHHWHHHHRLAHIALRKYHHWNRVWHHWNHVFWVHIRRRDAIGRQRHHAFQKFRHFLHSYHVHNHWRGVYLVRWQNRKQWHAPHNRHRLARWHHHRRRCIHFRNLMHHFALHKRWHQRNHNHHLAQMEARRVRFLEIEMGTEENYRVMHRERTNQFNHHKHRGMHFDRRLTHHNHMYKRHMNEAKRLNDHANHVRHVHHRNPKHVEHVLRHLKPKINHRLRQARHEGNIAKNLSNVLRRELELAQKARDRLHYYNLASGSKAAEIGRAKAHARVMQMLRNPVIVKVRKAGQQARAQRFVALRDLVRIEKMDMKESKRTELRNRLRQILLETRRVLDKEWLLFRDIRNVAKSGGVNHPGLEKMKSPRQLIAQEHALNAKIGGARFWRHVCHKKMLMFDTKRPIVVHATYGPANVTKKLQKLFDQARKAKSRVFYIGRYQYNKLFGDPRHGVYKHLKVVWKDETGHTHRLTFGERDIAGMTLGYDCSKKNISK